MSDLTAEVNKTATGLQVKGYEALDYNFHYITPVWDPKENTHLAETYKKWGRVLIVIDHVVHPIYKDQIEAYFGHYQIPITWSVIQGGELNKNMDTFNNIVDNMDAYGLVRKEPVLVVGGGLVTDVAGFACASYRRSSNFIRVPTTLIGLIDASVSIKVGLNHKKLKNRLGAYHAPIDTYLDFSMLKTLPIGQIRNGTAELIKIASVGEARVWELLVKYGKGLVETGYGYKEGGEKFIQPGEEVTKKGIEIMLQLESPNLHELGLDRVIAFGHSFSPTLELTPRIPLRHGHAITIDMAYSVTLAHSRGHLSDALRDEWFTLANSIGLSIDHPAFDDELIVVSCEAIKKTRDGKQRFAIPDGEFGKCIFLNDVSNEELRSVLKTHKQFIKERYNYDGVGQDAFCDVNDLGADPEKYVKSEEKNEVNGGTKSLQREGLDNTKKAAISAGAVPVDGSGHLTNSETGTAKA